VRAAKVTALTEPADVRATACPCLVPKPVEKVLKPQASLVAILRPTITHGYLTGTNGQPSRTSSSNRAT